MSLTPGIYITKIKWNGVGSSQNNTPFVKLICAYDEQDISVFIYLSDKAMGMARAALKRCGFDPDNTELKQLRDNPTLLAGNTVKVEYIVDEYGEKGQVLLTDVTDGNLDKLTAKLRAANKGGNQESLPMDDKEDDLPF